MRPSHQHDAPAEYTIVVKGRFTPSTVVLTPGHRHRLVFRRDETSGCSEHVVFPTLGRSVLLPPFEEVVLELPDLRPGTYPISCQRGVLYGRLVIRNHRR